MNNILSQIVNRNQNECHEIDENIKNKILQEIILSGLSRTDFFRNCTLFGDSAFSIFYGDEILGNALNFALCSPNLEFDINEYLPAVKNEFSSLGFEVLSVETFKKDINLIEVQFHLKSIFDIFNFADALSKGNSRETEDIEIKFVIDLNASNFACFEVKFGYEPYPYHAKMYDFPTLFADKIQTLLCENLPDEALLKEIHDYEVYCGFGESVNLSYLKERLVKSDLIDKNFDLTIDKFKQLLIEKFDKIDFEKLKDDNFDIYDNNLEVWGKEYFADMTKKLIGN